MEKNYAAGLAAGLATVAVGHPFDTVKVNLQARSPAAHSSAIRCAGWILSHEGVSNIDLFLPDLYRIFDRVVVSVSISRSGDCTKAPLLRSLGWQSKARCCSGSTRRRRRHCRKGGEAVNSSPKMSTVLPAAAFGGAIISLILCPTELVKCRLQVQEKASSSSRYTGPLDCAKKTFQSGGIPGLFRGWSATCCRESVGNMCFFATYETSRSFMLSYLSNDNGISSRLQRGSFSQTLLEAAVGIVTGGISGMVFWTVVLPFDVAKTRIQTAVDLTESRSVLFNLRKIRKELGVRGLYTGLGPTLIRAFPANAAAIVTLELTSKLLGTRQMQQQSIESSLV